MAFYIVIGDSRENDCHKIYLHGTLKECRNKARSLLIHWNKDYFNLKKRRELVKRSDKDFCDVFIGPWLRSPSIIRLPRRKGENF